MNSEQLESAKKLFFIVLGVDIAVTALAASSAFWGSGELRAIQSGSREVTQSLIGTLEFWESFSKLTILTLIGVGLGLVKWLNASYRFAKESLGATGFKNEGWTGAGWIVPIFFLFKPYQVINEIYKAGARGYSTPDDWKKESSSGLLLTWWIFWVVTHLIIISVVKVVNRKSFRDDLALPQVIGIYDAQAWVFVISLVVAVLWFVVANHLTQRLLDRPSLLSIGPKADLSLRTQPVTSIPVATSTQYAGIPPHAQTDQPARATKSSSSAHESLQERTAVDEDAVYADIATELESGALDKGLWTRLFAECDGDESKTKAAYIRQRANQLLARNHLIASQGSSEASFSARPPVETALSGDSERPSAPANLSIFANYRSWLVAVFALILGGALLYWVSGKPGLSKIESTTNSASAGAAQPSPVIDEAAEKRIRRKNAEDTLNAYDEKWRDTIGLPDGAGNIPDTKFRQWLAKQPKEYEDLVKSTYDASVLMDALSKFKAAPMNCEANAVSKDGRPLIGRAKAVSIKKCCEANAVSIEGRPLEGAAKVFFINRCLGQHSAERGKGGASCTGPRECEAGFECRTGRCEAKPKVPGKGKPCETDGECAAKLYCSQGKCSPRNKRGKYCDRDTDCAENLYCVRGLCG